MGGLMDAPLSPGRPPSSGIESSARTIERLAEELGASDIFVFRCGTSSRFVHVGGAGRGKTVTAPLEVDVDTDRFGARLRVGQPLWLRYRKPQRIFGPLSRSQRGGRTAQSGRAGGVRRNHCAGVRFRADHRHPHRGSRARHRVVRESHARAASGRGVGVVHARKASAARRSRVAARHC